MQPIEKRIAALEDSASDKGLKLIVVLNGESHAEALRRLGLPPAYLRVAYLTELDELI